MRSKPDLEPGEELRFGKYIVEIVKRRLEGKSSVKRENAKTSKDYPISPVKQLFPKGSKTKQRSPSTGSSLAN